MYKALANAIRSIAYRYLYATKNIILQTHFPVSPMLGVKIMKHRLIHAKGFASKSVITGCNTLLSTVTFVL
jgi:hypothetical protein